eukprot:scaffold34739_cov43-Phaeocystis_antarctica.AAC.1
MGTSWTCSGGTWAAVPAAKSSENRRASVTDASSTPRSLREASWTCGGGTWAAATAARSSESRRASVTDASSTPSSLMGASSLHLGRRYRREEQRE